MLFNLLMGGSANHSIGRAESVFVPFTRRMLQAIHSYPRVRWAYEAVILTAATAHPSPALHLAASNFVLLLLPVLLIPDVSLPVQSPPRRRLSTMSRSCLILRHYNLPTNAQVSLQLASGVSL